MSTELIQFTVLAWLLAGLLGLVRRGPGTARGLLAAGALALILTALLDLPGASATLSLPLPLTTTVEFQLPPAALWLLGFGLVPAALACALASPGRESSPLWLTGAALALLGSLGVCGLREGAAFLIAWELMSLGGALLILAERLGRPGQPVLFMLALLEAGSIALLAAILLFGGNGLDFAGFAASGAAAAPGLRLLLGLLLLIGFGAKLGLLPFYEWFPAAYGSASGATGALLSGVVLNAAYFGLARGLVEWLPGTGNSGLVLSVIVILLSAVSAALAILYAFQADDWRQLLSLSSAENAAVACTALGSALLFRHGDLIKLAALAWTVALLHLAGHSLAKGALFLTADGVFRATGDYRIEQHGLLRRSAWPLGLGALFAAMSLAAMPPQAGFVSEWYVFQTVFQGFHLTSLGGPLVLAVAGAALALTAAVALATFIKVCGLGLLGDGTAHEPGIAGRYGAAVGLLGLLVLVTAIGMPWWLSGLDQAAQHTLGAGTDALRDHWLLVPLSAGFAFISPTKLVIAGPLLALLPILLFLTARQQHARRVPVWYGGQPRPSARVATTPLAFSNALRTFYSFVYRPVQDLRAEHRDHVYFVHRLIFDHRVAPLFGPALFRPLEHAVQGLARGLRPLQSGQMNLYLAIIGLTLVLILLLPLF